MKLTSQEKAARKAAFRALSPAKKLEHIFTYYLWYILLGLAALLVLGSVLQRQLTKKETVLSVAFANVSVGEDLETALTEAYLLASDRDPRRQEVYLYRDLYLSEDADTLNHEYAYASRMKLMGAVQAQRLDIVLMNREAYDLLSRQGYLLELDALPEKLREKLAANEVVLADNGIEWRLGEADEHELVTESVLNALDASKLPLFSGAGLSDRVYLGVIANSPRVDEAVRYLRYLSEES